MKKLLCVLLLTSSVIHGQVIHVDFNDAVYPFVNQSFSYPSIDINLDGVGDFVLATNFSGSNTVGTYFRFTNASSSPNHRVNGPLSATIVGIDCNNDTLNSFDSWSTISNALLYSVVPANAFNLGVGSHKQGFRMVLNNPANGGLGYKYGYFNYTISSNNDIVLHDWYYQNTFNAPIWANSQLTFPSSQNCLQVDTVYYYDTVTTNITIYDTITTQINVYDTVLVSVTDTLIINTALSLPAPNNSNVIKVYPNPASDHVTIDNGNYALMSGYTVKIENSSGQQVFTSLVNQAQFYIDISNWTGNGMYYIHLIDPQNNTVTIRKIVVQ